MTCPPLASFTCRDDYTGLERLALAMKPHGSLAGAASIEASSGTFPSLCKLEPALMPSSGAFPPRWATSGVGTRGRLGLRLSRAHTSFKMQCIATVMDDVSEGGRRDAGRQPDLPSQEEGLKSSQSDSSSTAALELGVLDGEKGTALGLRVEER
jgi:hypothetical protein